MKTIVELLKFFLGKVFELLGTLIKPLVEESKENLVLTIYDLGKVVCICFIVWYLYSWMLNRKQASIKLYFSAMAYIVFDMLYKKG